MSEFPEYTKIADDLAQVSFAVVDNFLTAEEVLALRALPEFQYAETQFKAARIGKSESLMANEAIRGDRIQWIDENSAPELQAYLQKLRQMVEALNRELFLSLKDAEVHMTVYPAGTWYRRHLDQFHRDDHRKLSVITYLNPEWEVNDGGELVLYLPEETRKVLPVAGRMVVFRSDVLEHEVLPGLKPRYSLTGWMLDTLADLR